MSYSCPMHTEAVKLEPGFCPICGMSLEPTIPTDNVSADKKDLLLRLIVGSILTSFVILFSMQILTNSENISRIAQFLLTTCVVFWSGWPILKKAWFSVIHRALNMFSLIALGVGAAYLYSIAALWYGSKDLYFEPAAAITTIVLLGQLLEQVVEKRTKSSLLLLMKRSAKKARLVNAHEDIEIPVDGVQKGYLLRVKPGDKIPVDGEILEGSGVIDESMITGEPTPIEKSPRQFVYGSSINTSGSFIMKATRVGKETFLSQIIEMVSRAQTTKAPVQKTVDRISAIFIPIVLTISVLTFVLWWLLGPEPRILHSLINAVAVLIIACPCALGLATPLSIMVGLGKGAEHGILFKNAQTLELLEKVDTLLVDKTGTLTEGHPKVIQVLPIPPMSYQEAIQIAASIEFYSEHPLSLAITQLAQDKNISLLKTTHFESIPGKGVMGSIQGKKFIIGKESYMESNLISIPFQMRKESRNHEDEAQTVIYLGSDESIIAQFILEDPIKPDAKESIQKLKSLGIKVTMASGDSKATATAVAKKLQIDEVSAQLLPSEKNELIQKLKESHHIVAMAGDGINDAPALASAHVGIAMGHGTDVAIECAGLTLIKGNLYGIYQGILLSRSVMTNIRQNLFFAFLYNCIGILVAAGLLYPFFGIVLSPVIASIAMSLSSLSVVLNALRLRKTSMV